MLKSGRLTAGVSCGGWEGGLAAETGKPQSHENAQKTRRVPTVSCTLCSAALKIVYDNAFINILLCEECVDPNNERTLLQQNHLHVNIFLVVQNGY